MVFSDPAVLEPDALSLHGRSGCFGRAAPRPFRWVCSRDSCAGDGSAQPSRTVLALPPHGVAWGLEERALNFWCSIRTLHPKASAAGAAQGKVLPWAGFPLARTGWIVQSGRGMA